MKTKMTFGEVLKSLEKSEVFPFPYNLLMYDFVQMLSGWKDIRELFTVPCQVTYEIFTTESDDIMFVWKTELEILDKEQLKAFQSIRWRKITMKGGNLLFEFSGSGENCLVIRVIRYNKEY